MFLFGNKRKYWKTVSSGREVVPLNFPDHSCIIITDAKHTRMSFDAKGREKMKDTITTDLLIADIKNGKKETIISLLFTFITITAIAAYILYPFEAFSFINLLLIIFAVFVIVTLVIMNRGQTVIRQIKSNHIDIYEDVVVKMAITRDGKGTTHYLVFKDYQPAKELGVRVSNKQYDKCELNDKYYIICVKTAAKPYLLVYPTKSYILHEDMAERMRKKEGF